MLALHTNSLKTYGINRVFEFAKAAGYDGVEVGVTRHNFDTQNASYLKELSQAYGMPILALEAPHLATPKSVEHVVDMATYLKCPMVVITPPKLLDFAFASWLKKEIGALRKKSKVSIALLNAPNKTFLGFLPEHSMTSLADLQNFKLVALDTSSTVSKKIELMHIYERLKKNIVHVHLSNVRRHHEYALPNEGILPLESFLKKLKENKYTGVISVLVNPSELFAGDDEKVVQMLKRAKAFYEEYYLK